jgi:hypothetical protein
MQKYSYFLLLMSTSAKQFDHYDPKMWSQIYSKDASRRRSCDTTTSLSHSQKRKNSYRTTTPLGQKRKKPGPAIPCAIKPSNPSHTSAKNKDVPRGKQLPSYTTGQKMRRTENPKKLHKQDHKTLPLHPSPDTTHAYT